MTTFHNEAVDNLFSTDAEFRAWAIEYDKALKASGFLIPTTDTGQVDFATMVRPSSGFAGYKMYKASDALQATKPIFVKMEFGVAGTTARPRLQFGVGTTTDGAGNLGGQVSSAMTLLNPGGDGSGSCRIFGGGGEADAWACTQDGAITPQGSHFQIGRLLDRDDGSEVGPISWFTYSSSLSSTPYGNMNYSDGASGWGSVSQGMTTFVPDLNSPIHTGGDVNKTLLYEMLVYRNAKTLVFPVVAGRAQELPFTDPDSSAFSLAVWGGNHTFVPIPWAVGASNRPCLLWE